MEYSLLFSVIFCFLWGSCVASASCYNAIYSFGDSLADTGNLLASGPKLFKEITNPPYGESYFHKATGRCSDGRLVVDYLGMYVSNFFRKDLLFFQVMH
jgi:hypothetical protein